MTDKLMSDTKESDKMEFRDDESTSGSLRFKDNQDGLRVKDKVFEIKD